MANNFLLLTYLSVGSIGATQAGSMRSCSSSSKFSLLAMIVTLSIDPRRHKFVFGNPVTFYSYSNVFAGLGENMSPFCADFNDDGLNDCIVGTKSNDVAYFENTGSASTFTFASGASPTQSNFLEFSSGDLTYSTPFCADMDNDGDLDCLIGSSDGMIYYKENRGTASTADFTNSFDSSDYFNKDLGDYSSVTCYDLDNDGDYDCILGDEEGDIYYFENFQVILHLSIKCRPFVYSTMQFNSYKITDGVGMSVN